MGLIISTSGTFDLFHSGHARLLERCAELGQVVVILNTDEFIESYKGKPPVCNFYERRAVLESCKFVSGVVANIGGADSRPAIDALMPNIIAIGSDWARKDYHRQMGFDQAWLDERDIGLIYLPYTPRISTTRIRNAANL